MPELPPKNWGKVDKAALRDLIDDGTVDVNDLSAQTIDAIRDEYFIMSVVVVVVDCPIANGEK